VNPKVGAALTVSPHLGENWPERKQNGSPICSAPRESGESLEAHMSEWFYRQLLALYPRRFRQEYGQQALELFRERKQAETGFFAHLQLWFDLILDAAVSIPREYWRREPAVKAVPATDGGPVFFTF
jgi:hypothetical protein